MTTRATCTECGYSKVSRTRGLAEFGISKHSCEKHRAEIRRRAKSAERKASLDTTERPCTHKTHHAHGSYVRFTLDHCHCAPCRDAKRVYELERRRAKAYGQVRFVDPEPVRRHLRSLMAAGLGWKRVAHKAGVAESVVYPILYGRNDRKHGGLITRMLRVNAEAILAVPMPTLDDFANGTRVSAAGARRRLRALVSAGWSVGQIALASALDRQVLDAITSGRREQTSAGTARAVREAYEQLWNEAPPEVDHRSRIAASRSRRRAGREGWPMPLDLDDCTIDNPAVADPTRSTPDVRKAPFDLAEWEHLLRTGEDPARAAKRCGAGLRTVVRHAQDAGREDLARIAMRAEKEVR